MGASGYSDQTELPATPLEESSLPQDATTEADSGMNPAAGADGSRPRQLVSQGSITITTEDPIEAADDAVGIVEGDGGRVDSRNEDPGGEGDGDTARADLVVRIPSAQLTQSLDRIKALGEVEAVQLGGSDVTAQSEDLDARILALSTSTERLTGLLASASTTKDLLDIETTLSTRQSDLESLQAQRRALVDQVELATISVAFGTTATAPIDTPDTFLSGLATGWDSLVAFTGSVLVAFGVALPWLAIAGVVIGFVLLLARRRRPVATGRMDE